MSKLSPHGQYEDIRQTDRQTDRQCLSSCMYSNSKCVVTCKPHADEQLDVQQLEVQQLEFQHLEVQIFCT